MSELVVSNPSTDLTALALPPREQGAVDDPSRDIRVGAIVAILFFVVFLGWAAFARLDAAAVAPGRLAVSGDSLRVDSARIELKPPTPRMVMVDSVPPAIITSHSPQRISRAASPTEWALDEQADTCEKFGPRAPVRIETTPGTMLMIRSATKYGDRP